MKFDELKRLTNYLARSLIISLIIEAVYALRMIRKVEREFVFY